MYIGPYSSNPCRSMVSTVINSWTLLLVIYPSEKLAYMQCAYLWVYMYRVAIIYNSKTMEKTQTSTSRDRLNPPSVKLCGCRKRGKPPVTSSIWWQERTYRMHSWEEQDPKSCLIREIQNQIFTISYIYIHERNIRETNEMGAYRGGSGSGEGGRKGWEALHCVPL